MNPTLADAEHEAETLKIEAVYVNHFTVAVCPPVVRLTFGEQSVRGIMQPRVAVVLPFNDMALLLELMMSVIAQQNKPKEGRDN